MLYSMKTLEQISAKAGNMPTLGKGMVWVSKTFKTKTIRSCDEAKKTVMKCHDGFVGLC